MKLSTFLILLNTTTVFAAPLLVRREDKKDWTPGANISPSECAKDKYNSHSCTARLPSRNIFVTANHAVVSKGDSVNTPANNGLAAGWTKDGNEVRTYAGIRSFPGGGPNGQRCRFHFITDGDSKLVSRDDIDHWNVYTVGNAGGSFGDNMKWDDAPGHSEKPVATFITDITRATVARPDKGAEEDPKWSHTFLDGVDFICPISDVAYLVAPAGGKPKKEGKMMEVGGHNGLGVEVLFTENYSGWGYPGMKKGENP